MKAKQKLLIFLLILLAAFGVAYLLLTKANEAAAQSASESGEIVLSSFSADSLESIGYTYNGENILLEKQDGSWILADDPDYHVNQTTVNSMATALCQLSASQVIENVSDYTQYGTDTPELTVTAQVDGETMTFSFGGQNTVSSVGYLQMAGDDNVYAVASSLESTFQYGKANLYDTSWLPVTLLRTDLTRIDYHYRADGTENTVTLQAQSEPADSGASTADSTTYTQTWYVTDTGDKAITKMVTTMLDAVFTAPTAQITAPGDLAAYGLTEPALTVKLTDNAGAEQTLSVGVGTDGWYLMRDGDTGVYTVTADMLKAFAYSSEQLKQQATDDALSAESALSTGLEAAN